MIDKNIKSMPRRADNVINRDKEQSNNIKIKSLTTCHVNNSIVHLINKQVTNELPTSNNTSHYLKDNFYIKNRRKYESRHFFVIKTIT